ncbi:serine/threonine protein kinase [Cetobacterium ceti]|uniref:Serine/threonine protein kinase n=1 Tax=Cetobacterium ceti TaxID=180163 RepID=A0A1T4KK62_9FUSO|nr:PASTA domain-containing protein [Cetobacterium ceti]SJZ42799.1 serine/threonine protein kinase [Cetobacterium ceti]
MKKIIVIFLSILAFLASIFFAFNIFLKVYFNEFFYYTPDFKGLTLEEVNKMNSQNIFDIKVAGSEYSNYPPGEIFMQEPHTNRVIKKGRDIKIWISKGSDEIELPNLQGKNLIDITGLLQRDGLNIRKTSYVITPLPYNTIITTNPLPGAKVKRGDSISILVSDVENKKVSMPDLVGIEFNKAKDLLSKNYLSVGNITYKETDYLDPGIVIETSIPSREEVSAGTAVDLIVSK